MTISARTQGMAVTGLRMDCVFTMDTLVEKYQNVLAVLSKSEPENTMLPSMKNICGALVKSKAQLSGPPAKVSGKPA
eukprot:6082250-Karenia_brevis.AAC.1